MEKDIAIVGMSCRFPGANNYSEYWEVLNNGRNEVSKIPENRWNCEEINTGLANSENISISKWGGFIEDVASFDPLFFNISPTEANYIDPQHRLFLEESWHCLEDAGYSVDELTGKSIGVYAGVSKNDYAELMREKKKKIISFVSTGTVHSILANRVSYTFDFKGKSEVVDTACSSFLVALNNAVNDIRTGQCEAALVGGVNLMLSPTMFIAHSMSGMLSSSGVCRSFDVNADGYVRGEGVGVIYIKSLKEAIRQNDNIIGVIKGIAVRHGGQGNFLTAPKASSQAETIRLALQDGGVEANSITYIEAHGTGTPLGDPIEFSGLSQVYTSEGTDIPCYLSSAKSNIGHLESAAGVAGLIKVLLSMKYGVIPKVVHFTSTNPQIKLNNTRLKIADQNIDWACLHRDTSAKYRAGISSFGMGGVNAHAIIESWNEQGGENVRPNVVQQSAEIHAFPYSASDLKNLIELLKRHSAHYKRFNNDLLLENIAFTLQLGRKHFASRLCILASSVKELIFKIDSYTSNATEHNEQIIVESNNTTVLQQLLKKSRNWIEGDDAVWESQYTNRRIQRIPLPGYQFNKRYCWFDESFSINNKCEKNTTELTGESISTIYVSVDDFYLTHHVVQGEQIIPAAKFLTLLLDHLKKQSSESYGLRDIFWLAPFRLDKQRKKKLFVRSKHSDSKYYVRIYDDEHEYVTATAFDYHIENNEKNAGALNCNASGESGCVMQQDDIYTRLKDNGLEYGDYYRVIDKVVVNTTEAIADIEAKSQRTGSYYDDVAIIDSVFQTVVVFQTEQSGNDVEYQFVPFYLKEFVWMDTEISKKLTVHVVKHDNEKQSLKYNMSLYTDNGKLLSRFIGFQKNKYCRLNKEQNYKQRSLNLYTSELREYPLSMQAEKANSITIISNATPSFFSLSSQNKSDLNYINKSNLEGGKKIESISKLLSNIVEGHVIGVIDDRLTNPSETSDDVDYLTVFKLVRYLLNNRITKPIHIYYAYLYDIETIQRSPSILAGFARTLKIENPHVRLETIGFDSENPTEWQTKLYNEIQSYHYAPLCEVTWKGAVRYDKVIRECKNQELVLKNDSNQSHSLIKHAGVYLIAGGAGAIGSVFAMYLAKNYKAEIHLVGRSSRGSVHNKLIENINSTGSKGYYWACDISQPQQVEDLFTKIQEDEVKFDGVIFCVGLIEDSFILNKQTDSFKRVLSPKVDGILNLDKSTSTHPLDFFVLTSSVAAYMPNHGQCDYAGANSFLDRYASYRNSLVQSSERSGRTISLNWPLWQSGGIRVTKEEERYLREVFGMDQITTDAALAVFEYSLLNDTSNGLSHLIAIDGDKKKIDKSLNAQKQYDLLLNRDYSEHDNIEEKLISEVSSYLQKNSKDSVVIDKRMRLSQQGIDSVGIVYLAEKIQTHFDIDLGPTMLFELNTINLLVEYILNNLPKSSNHSIGTGSCKTVTDGFQNQQALLELSRSNPSVGHFERTLSGQEYFMRDHVVENEYNVPGACFIEMALEAFVCTTQCDFASHAVRMRNNYWAKQLSTKGDEFIAELNIDTKETINKYQITSKKNDKDELYAEGDLELIKHSHVELTKSPIQRNYTLSRERDEIYEYIWAEGLHIGRTLMPMDSIVLNDQEAIANCTLPEIIRHTITDYILHPTLFTGILQTALLNNKPKGLNKDKYIPIGVDEIVIYSPMSVSCVVHSKKRKLQSEHNIKKFDAEVYGEDGQLIVTLSGITLRRTTNINKKEGEMIRQNKTILNKQIDDVVGYISKLLAQTVGLKDNEIEPDIMFEKYGINSIIIIEINRKLEKIFGNISKTLLFEYQTVRELSDFFYNNYLSVLIEKKIVRQELVEENNLYIDKNEAYNNSNNDNEKSIINSDILHENENNKNNIRSVTVQQDISGHNNRSQESTIKKPNTVLSPMQDDDIAIIGVAGVYPGANDIYQFWSNLKNGIDSITETPKDRLDIDIFDKDNFTNTANCKWGGYLASIEQFDPEFFNISPREAYNLDPQERIFLQVAWNTVENAGYDANMLRGLNYGVYVGALWQPYTCLGVAETNKGNTQTPNGLLYNIPNRVSYYFDWTGPSVAIDTACSSSLTALHVAYQSIKCEEVEAALVGGVNLSFSSSKFLWLNSNHFLSTEGKCRSFGQGGDGYVPGEGVGAVLMKRLSEAVKDNDHIWGVIRASSINHGGRTNGFTVPNPIKQRDLILSSLTKGKVSARDISYVEAHGTGTSLGDPIEITGLKQAFEQTTNEKQFCSIGSVKSNIGHLEAAAGIAGLTKTLMQLENKLKVPSLHCEIENENIDFGDTPFTIQKTISYWENNSSSTSNPRPRTAMISSFGAGGSNAHLIVSEFIGGKKIQYLAPNNEDNIRNILFPFSARTIGSLIATLKSFQEYLKTVDPELLHHIACTLQEGRSQMNVRVIFVASTLDELIKKITEFLKIQTTQQNEISSSTKRDSDLKIIDRDDIQILVKHWISCEYVDKITKLWESGYDYEWRSLFGQAEFMRVPLPVYKFENKDYKMPRILLEKYLNNNLHEKTTNKSIFHVKNVSNLYKMQYEIHVSSKAVISHEDSLTIESLNHQFNDILRNIANNVMDCDTQQQSFEEIHENFNDKERFIIDILPITDENNENLSGVMLSITSDSGNKYKLSYIPRILATQRADAKDEDKYSEHNIITKQSCDSSTNSIAYKKEQQSAQVSISNQEVNLEKPNSIKLANIADIKTCETIRQLEPACEKSNTSLECEDNYPDCYPNIGMLKSCISSSLNKDSSQITQKTLLKDLSLKETEIEFLVNNISSRFSIQINSDDYNVLFTVEELLDLISKKSLHTSSKSNLFSVENKQEFDIKGFLLKTLAEVLYTEIKQINITKPFVDMGLDSILGVEWIDLINSNYNLEIAATIIYDYPTIESLAEYIDELLNNSVKSLMEEESCT